MKSFLTFLAAAFILGLTMGQVYLCTYTEFPKLYLYFTPIPVAILAGIMAGGVKGDPTKVTGTDARGNLNVSVTYGVFGLMLVILYIFTFIALNER
jgi:hypothetical protein